MVFGLAPAFAPILGGWLLAAFGWRAIFGFIIAFTLVMLIASLRLLPESLAPTRRHPFHLKVILSHYANVGSHAPFLFMCLGNALTFTCVSVYIGSASAFIYDILHLSQKDFGWLFIPLIGGMTIGSILSARLSHRVAPNTIIRLGFILMFLSALANLGYNLFFMAQIPWAVVPPFFYCIGMAFCAPAMAILMLEMFPKTRGLASSLMSFVFMLLFALVSGLLCPLIFDSALHLAETIFAGFVLSVIFWTLGAPRGLGDRPIEHIKTPEEIPVEI
jgi:DHA1 family bicyclomycin/chloramphenicol resistance-like MFS transporter